MLKQEEEAYLWTQGEVESEDRGGALHFPVEEFKRQGEK